MRARRREAGFSLIEVMISLVIIGLTLALGVPMFQTWIQNTQIRTAGEAIVNGLQQARNEAIRTNRSVHFEFTTGTGYKLNPRAEPENDPAFRVRDASEGSENAVATTTPAGSKVVTFTALGRVESTNYDGSDVMTQIDVDNPNMAAADSRELRIVIPPGGGIRMCDPQVAAGDPRAC